MRIEVCAQDATVFFLFITQKEHHYLCAMLLITNATCKEHLSLLAALNKENFNNNYVLINKATDHTLLTGLKIEQALAPSELPQWLAENGEELEFILDDSTNDIELSKKLWQFGYENQVPIIFTKLSPSLKDWISGHKNAPFYWAAFSKDFPTSEVIINCLFNREKKGFID